jgi:hypothetical protein
MKSSGATNWHDGQITMSIRPRKNIPLAPSSVMESEPVIGLAEGETRWRRMTAESAVTASLNTPHSIPDSSSSAFFINSSLTTTVCRGTRKNIADAQAIDRAKIAAVSGSVVVEWPPR